MNKYIAYEKLENRIEEIKQTNDYILGLKSKLHIVLINLKIENARIENINTGIAPIADELEKLIKDIGNKVNNLVAYREEIDEIIDVIKKEIHNND